MQLSAIVPTHERPVALRRCLETLKAQDGAADRLEVVVVDDGSSADIQGLVAAVAGDGPVAMRCERQALGGLNRARNRGAASARGDVLAFLDDDTLVSPGWAAALLAAFQNHPAAAIGGRVVLALDGPAPPWLAPRRYYLAEYDLGEEPCWLDGDPVPVGANCAVRRGEFERVGGFRDGLDRFGGSLVSNGDTEFFRRLRAGGGRLRYEPAARVTHCIPAERLTIDYFVKRHFAQGVSDELMAELERPTASTATQLARLARELRALIGPQTTTVAKDILRGRGTVNARFFSSYWRGRMTAVGKRP
jgi:GT2 family glycosyltransferase